jgi:hypothetical protein
MIQIRTMIRRFKRVTHTIDQSIAPRAIPVLSRLGKTKLLPIVKKCIVHSRCQHLAASNPASVTQDHAISNQVKFKIVDLRISHNR